MDVLLIFFFVHSSESVLDMKHVDFDDNNVPMVVPYLEQFPFSFYLVLKDIANLPKSLSDSIKQWFELVSKH